MGQRIRGVVLHASGTAMMVATIAALAPIAGVSAPRINAPLWTERYNGPGNSLETAYSVAASPDGSTVYVTGRSIGSGTSYATIAYDAATGLPLWKERYDGPASGSDVAHSVAASPDGSKVFVTGQSAGSGTEDDLRHDRISGCMTHAGRSGLLTIGLSGADPRWSVSPPPPRGSISGGIAVG